jgi:vitamin B12/bleomycin/antimicrobial peptide transport system ATP-binding/permease protein
MSSNNRRTWSHLLTIGKPLFAPERRWRTFTGLGLIVALLLSLNGLNVVNSYIGRGFMTAIADHEVHRFHLFALGYAGVFAASTIVAVFYQFSQDRLALLWREWLTRYLTDRYLSNLAYYRLSKRADIDNPDQRISENVSSFTLTLLSFVLMLLNSTMTTIAFAGILWSISWWLLLGAVLYAAFGSLGTILLGRRLVFFDNLQLQKEADLRFGLVHIREHVEAIALLHGETRENDQIRSRLQKVVDNMKRVIAINRNVGFFTSGFNYLTPILPVLIVAPMYLRGEIEFGVVTQSAMAFAQLLGALSIIVAQFQNISSFAAVVNRLGSLWEALEAARVPANRTIQVVEDCKRVAFEHLTLRTPKNNRLLLEDLSLDVPRGQRLLILGEDGAGKSALFRAAGGLWETGSGKVVRPPREQLLFLPAEPYLPSGTIRTQLVYGLPEDKFTDEWLVRVLHCLKFDYIVERMGGLDVEHDWAHVLSAGEQQLLAFARLLLANPRFAFLDRSVNALPPQRAKQLYQVLSATTISYLSIGDHIHIQEYHDTVLELHDNGSWRVHPAQSARSA